MYTLVRAHSVANTRVYTPPAPPGCICSCQPYIMVAIIRYIW